MINKTLKVTYKRGDVVISNELDELNYAISKGYIEKIEFAYNYDKWHASDKMKVLNKYTHLLTGNRYNVIQALGKLDIIYMNDDFEIYITEDDYSKYKNDLAKAGII
jgi:hypothetical protein